MKVIRKKSKKTEIREYFEQEYPGYEIYIRDDDDGLLSVRVVKWEPKEVDTLFGGKKVKEVQSHAKVVKVKHDDSAEPTILTIYE